MHILREAAKLCKEVAAEGDALTLGSLSQCPSYLDGLGETKVHVGYWHLKIIAGSHLCLSVIE